METKTKENPPKAYELRNSRRSIGYGFESAVCDVIDNSISANCTEVRIYRPLSADSLYFEIIDNGIGMDEQELVNAMRYGADCNRERNSNDLGRFGLGLKSASLSQCKKLTVISKKDGKVCGACWDRDYIKQSDSWELIILDKESTSKIPNINYFETHASGTIVLWEKFDVIKKASGDKLYDQFSKLIASTKERIQLVYHRFMDFGFRYHANKKITFYCNNSELEPSDPFLSYKKETTESAEIILNEVDSKGENQVIKCVSFVLPFQSMILSEDERRLGSTNEIANNQGFYIYRSFRLISWGRWRGIRPSSLLSKYGRILVDIPPALDDKWGIDVKKEKAIIPAEIKNQLSKTVDITRKKSKDRVSKRTIEETKDNKLLWMVLKDRNNQKVLAINKESYILENFIKKLTSEQQTEFNFILDSISESLPYLNVISDYADTTPPREICLQDKANIINAALKIIQLYSASYTDIEELINSICTNEPFSNYKGLDLILKEKLKNGNQR